MSQKRKEDASGLQRYCANSIIPGASTNSMIIISRYELIEKPHLGFKSVVSHETVPCPCCLGLKYRVIGSRKRSYTNKDGRPAVLSLRRLRCQQCRKIHHELPDVLIPYLRSESQVVEAVIDEASIEGHPAEKALSALELTGLNRWKQWYFKRLHHFVGALESIVFRYKLTCESDGHLESKSSLSRWVGSGSGWLARTVRVIANANLWPHTRMVLMSSP